MKYVSILRGINVSGQKKIKMADIKALYESLDLEDVVTYIQSGNVIFEAPGCHAVDLKNRIEKAIEQKYGFNVPVILRTNGEMTAIIENSPFGAIDLAQNGTKVLVTFLSSTPSAASISDLKQQVTVAEKLYVRGTEVYLYCPNGYGKSRLSNTLIERKLGLVATTRNWKTVHKLCELSL